MNIAKQYRQFNCFATIARRYNVQKTIKKKPRLLEAIHYLNPTNNYRVACIYGGSDEDRTRYLLHAMEALSQVSYGPITAQLLYIKRLFRQYDFIVFLYLVFLLSLFIDIISTTGKRK